MGTVLSIIAIAAVIGWLIGIFGSGKTEDAASGALTGAVMAGGCLFQLFIYGLMALAGLWLVKLIFFH